MDELAYLSATALVILLFTNAILHGYCGDFNNEVEITGSPDHVKILNNGQLLTLSLDKVSASGFRSRNEYLFGKFQMQLKLVPGNSAGTVTAYYLSSQGSAHDEIDLEFLGNISGEPYTLHTNIYTQGIGNKEQQFFLWFDPTQDFHTYTILWNPKHIVFYVDETPIREFKNATSAGIAFPSRQPMTLYSSIWNADDWATRGGHVKTDWTKAPFIASFRNYIADACVWVSGVSSCSSEAFTPSDHQWVTDELDSSQQRTLTTVRSKYMIYNYCTDYTRFPSGVPSECSMNT